MLSEQERLQALEAATIVVCPSPYESLSLIALEALAVGTPILCNARSEVLVDHCLRSNGGLFYRDRDEFVECHEAARRRRAPQSGHGTLRPRVRAPELPVGRRAWQVRQDDSARARQACNKTQDRRKKLFLPRSWYLTRALPPLLTASVRVPRATTPSPLPPRPDVVPLDHLVERRRLDVKQLGGASSARRRPLPASTRSAASRNR